MFGILSRNAALTLAGLSSGLWSTGAQTAVMTPGTRRKRAFRTAPAEATMPDWDLVRGAEALRTKGAQILYLFGEVMDFDGKPVQDARVEISQDGLDGPMEEISETVNFRGQGSMITDPLGLFMFRTILPMSHDGCAPHIDARVARPRGRTLETQIFLVDAPENEKDWHYQSLGPSRQAALSIDPVQRPDGDLEAGFNFVV